MTEQEFLDLITRNKAKTVLKRLAEIPEKERRQFAKTAHTSFKTFHKAVWDRQMEGKPIPLGIVEDGDAICVAVLATGVPSEIVGYGWQCFTANIEITDVFKALQPSWIDRWAEAIVEENPHMFRLVQEVCDAGLCRPPSTDAYIMGYYAHNRATADFVCDAFLQKDVWRFFEVEGGGEFSLASHDKYTSDANAWATVISHLCVEGRLDRDRLLDASLDALERDFGQFRAGWYSRFHLRLAPTTDEMVARAAQYLKLLGSMVPPTVSFSLKHLKQIDKAGELSPADLLASIEPALQARQKSSAVSALQLLKNCARRYPERAAEVSLAAVSALICEAGEVQERALDLIEQLGEAQNPDVMSTLDDYRDSVTPSVKNRLSDLLGTRKGDNADTTTAYPVPELEAITPVGSPEEAVATYLELLEDCADPFLMERSIDGLARFGAEAQPLLSPLAKRAKQVQKREIDGGYSPGKYYQRPISTTALAWASGKSFEEEFQPLLVARYWGHSPVKIKEHSFEGLFAARSQEILGFVQSGHAVPMLSAPTDNRGYLNPNTLIKRLQEYRRLGLQPGITDFKLALFRLAPENRVSALTDLNPATEAERALAYALGADVPPEMDKQLWVIAWSSRLPLTADPAIQTLVGGQIPGVGTPAVFEFDAYRYQPHDHSWPMPRIVMSPAPLAEEDHCLSFGTLHKSEGMISAMYPGSWMIQANPWVSILRPAHNELYAAAGILELQLDQKLAGHPCQVFLDPFFRPGFEPGPMAHALLAWYLAAADGAIGSVTTDAMATIIAQGIFDSSSFAHAASKLVFQAGLPLRRWTQRAREISAISPQHEDAVRTALSEMLTQLPEELPRDLGSILELLYELHIASETHVADPDLAKSLTSIKAGGKAGKFAKKLVSMGSN